MRFRSSGISCGIRSQRFWRLLLSLISRLPPTGFEQGSIDPHSHCCRHHEHFGFSFFILGHIVHPMEEDAFGQLEKQGASVSSRTGGHCTFTLSSDLYNWQCPCLFPLSRCYCHLSTLQAGHCSV